MKRHLEGLLVSVLTIGLGAVLMFGLYLFTEWYPRQGFIKEHSAYWSLVAQANDGPDQALIMRQLDHPDARLFVQGRAVIDPDTKIGQVFLLKFQPPSAATMTLVVRAGNTDQEIERKTWLGFRLQPIELKLP